MRRKDFEVNILKFLPSVLILVCALSNEVARGQMWASSSIILEGHSSGGILTLTKASRGNPPYILITNQPGESAVSVIGRLAERLTSCSICREYLGAPLSVSSNRIVLYGGPPKENYSSWILGGTERGFDLQTPPVSLTAIYSSNTMTLNWENPPGGYDTIGIIINADPWYSLSGTVTQFTYNSKMPGWSGGNVAYHVVGYKHGTPSNLVGVRLRDYVRQEFLMNVPFSWGIAPGFKTWMLNTSTNALQIEQGNLPGMNPETDVRSFDSKGFYQVLRGNSSFQGGVSRHFPGLIPGHTYRASARMNTFDTNDGNWSFTIHAAYNSAKGEELTPAQMAGVAALPNKTKGPDAALIARYNSSTNTAGKWLSCPSEKPEPGKFIGDVTLPENVNSLTVWFRLQGTHATNIVAGFDSLTLEDMGKL